ncbi:MAG: hypothetical protein M5R36_17810 [Deltaproteobacteria bacterium]|nr:hypothetical protein [Deltaproteobacteria bacterium]
MNVEFIGTNILIYAHDKSAGEKRDKARALVRRLLDEETGGLSVQVLLEFYYGVTRKLTPTMPHDTAARIVEDFATWNVYSPTPDDAVESIRLAARTSSISGMQ